MTFTTLQTLALTALVVYFGRFLKNRIHFIDKYNLPSPVIGGFVVAGVLSLLKGYQILEVQFDKSFEEPLMIAFFASIGYSASLKLLKEGGKAVFVFLVLAIIGLLVQLGAGVALAFSMGEHPLLGVLTGAVALTGGPGTALAFGPLIEEAGVEGGTLIGITTAMGGILLGGLIGTPIATHLIHRHRLKGDGKEVLLSEEVPVLSLRSGSDLLFHILALAIMMGVGTTLGAWFNHWGITLPVYIGSMIVAAIIRNIEDIKPIFKLNTEWIEEIGQVALTLFIATAIMTLKLDELRNAALPIFIFLTVQALIVALSAWGPVFWTLKKDYDSAIISAGYVGFMMGTSANAMANMSSLTAKYGPSPKAFLVVPLVGSCFIDFINAALVTICINFFN